MSSGFTVLCSADGVVLAAYGGSPIPPGTPLATIVARDSRHRLMAILNDARTTEQHTLLQMADGTALEFHCTGEGEQALVIAAPTAADVRRRCDEISEDATAGAMARRLAAGSRPDELSLDLWAELARVNNELSTAQRQLAKSNAELRWLNEQKNQLMGMAAHDLRNPLAAVLAYTHFLSIAEGLAPEQQHMLGRIRANVETMLAIVEDVLDFSAIEAGTVRLDRSELSVAELIDEITETNGLIAAKKNVRLASRIDPGLPPLVADKRKLMQVLDNLVTNAIKFSHPGSSVTIAAGPVREGGLLISVTDRGMGMSAEQAARMFVPFGRVGVEATGGEKGTGLGLAIVKRIVEAHLGHVEVESTPGAGTTVTVVLPTTG